jgi:hypothetical protein
MLLVLHSVLQSSACPLQVQVEGTIGSACASPLIEKEGAQVELSTLAHAIVKRTMRTSPASVPPPSSAPKKTRGTAAICASSVARKPWASKVRGSGAGQENISRSCVLRDAGLQVEERRTGLVEKARKRRLVANRRSDERRRRGPWRQLLLSFIFVVIGGGGGEESVKGRDERSDDGGVVDLQCGRREASRLVFVKICVR